MQMHRYRIWYRTESCKNMWLISFSKDILNYNKLTFTDSFESITSLKPLKSYKKF